MTFGRLFEEKFLNQNRFESRSVADTINLGWNLLGLLPKNQLDRVKTSMLNELYTAKTASDF
jgi:V/A-type H+-transporting ATPase subunit B